MISVLPRDENSSSACANKNQPGRSRVDCIKRRNRSEHFQSGIRRHQPLGADLVELEIHPALLVDFFGVQRVPSPEVRMDHPSRSHGWRRPKCRLRRPVRRWLWPEGTGEASGLAGVAFLLVTSLWPRKEKLLAQARRAGETLSRAMPSRPARRQPCQQRQAQTPLVSPPSSPTLLPQGEKGAKTLSGTGPSPAMGEGSKDDHGNRPLPHDGRRRQRLSRG